MINKRRVESYLFNTKGEIKNGNNSLSGLMVYRGRIPTGDGADIETIFVSPELRNGGKLINNGRRVGIIKYLGDGYTYKTNYCTLISPNEGTGRFLN